MNKKKKTFFKFKTIDGEEKLLLISKKEKEENHCLYASQSSTDLLSLFQ